MLSCTLWWLNQLIRQIIDGGGGANKLIKWIIDGGGGANKLIKQIMDGGGGAHVTGGTGAKVMKLLSRPAANMYVHVHAHGPSCFIYYSCGGKQFNCCTVESKPSVKANNTLASDCL